MPSLCVSLPMVLTVLSLSLSHTHTHQMPLVQSVFESNVVQLSELIAQREDVNAMVSHHLYTLCIVHTYICSHTSYCTTVC